MKQARVRHAHVKVYVPKDLSRWLDMLDELREHLHARIDARAAGRKLVPLVRITN